MQLSDTTTGFVTEVAYFFEWELVASRREGLYPYFVFFVEFYCTKWL